MRAEASESLKASLEEISKPEKERELKEKNKREYERNNPTWTNLQAPYRRFWEEQFSQKSLSY